MGDLFFPIEKPRMGGPISRAHLHISFLDLCISSGEIPISPEEIGISFAEIHKWKKEIPISLEEIGISLIRSPQDALG